MVDSWVVAVADDPGKSGVKVGGAGGSLYRHDRMAE